MVSISFPGLGIDRFTVNKVALSIGSIQIRWYGIIIVLGIIAAYLYAQHRAKQVGISSDDMMDVTLYTVMAGIIGARLYYVLTKLDEYDSFLEIVALWNGGLAIYGALIGGGIMLFIMCRIKKVSWKKIFDCASPGIMLAQAIGRWGNFFNGEAYGKCPEEGSLLYFTRMGLQHEGWQQEYFYAPTFFYESLWNLTGFVLINLFYKKKKFDLQIFFMYISWYGFGRMFIEGLRLDSLYVGQFRISQVVGFLCFVIGTVMLIILGLRSKKAASAVAAAGASEADNTEAVGDANTASDPAQEAGKAAEEETAVPEASDEEAPAPEAAEKADEADAEASEKSTETEAE